jgi:UDPglucose 6-dehydrogenase
VGYDPVAGANASREIGPGLELARSIYDAAKGADGVVISTDWDEFKSPDFERLAGVVRERAIFDGRNLYRGHEIRRHGFDYISVGRAPVYP